MQQTGYIRANEFYGNVYTNVGVPAEHPTKRCSLKRLDESFRPLYEENHYIAVFTYGTENRIVTSVRVTVFKKRIGQKDTYIMDTNEMIIDKNVMGESRTKMIDEFMEYANYATLYYYNKSDPTLDQNGFDKIFEWAKTGKAIDHAFKLNFKESCEHHEHIDYTCPKCFLYTMLFGSPLKNNQQQQQRFQKPYRYDRRSKYQQIY
jgi:hypothetical protein